MRNHLRFDPKLNIFNLFCPSRNREGALKMSNSFSRISGSSPPEMRSNVLVKEFDSFRETRIRLTFRQISEDSTKVEGRR